MKSAMTSIMPTRGAALGAMIAAAIISARTAPGETIPLESGFTIAFAMGAVAALAALLPTLLIRRRGRLARPVAALAPAH